MFFQLSGWFNFLADVFYLIDFSFSDNYFFIRPGLLFGLITTWALGTKNAFLLRTEETKIFFLSGLVIGNSGLAELDLSF